MKPGLFRIRPQAFAGSALAVGLCTCGVAGAEPFDTIHPYVGGNISYDANPLGIGSSADAQAVLGSSNKGDWSRTEQVGISLDDQISLQHVTLDINESKTTYDRFTALDYQAKNASGVWNWALGTHVGGTLSANYTQNLAPYAFIHELALNLRTQKNADFDFFWLFHPSWRIVGGVTAAQTHYDLSAEAPDDRTEYKSSLGLDYLQANGSATGVQVVQTRGYFQFPQDYGPVAIINNYSQDEVDAKIDWHLTGKTRVQFVGGVVDRKYEVLTDQNYRGTNFRAIVDWDITAKTSLNVQAWHEIGAVDNLTTVYSVNRGLSLTPTWNIDDKLRWDWQLQTEQRAFAQTASLFGAPTTGVTYTLHNARTVLTYHPTLKWQIQASLYYQSQTTSDHSNDYNGSGFQCSTRYQF